MKTLEELGISPAPWREWDDDVVTADYSPIVNSYDESYLSGPNAKLIAAAPELYDALLEAMGPCAKCDLDRECDGCMRRVSPWVAKARAAIRKAGGAE